MAGYTRTNPGDIVANEVVRAAPISAELNAIRDAFKLVGGHRHDGVNSDEGGYVPLIADLDANNKVVIDTTNNRVSIYSEVSGTPVEQVRVQDGAIVPVTDEDIDLGSPTAEFKDIYIDGVGYIDTLAIHENATITGNLTVDGHTTLGDGSGDMLMINSTIETNLMPSSIPGRLVNIGSPTSQWNNLYIDGTADIDSLVADTVDINAGTIDNTAIGSTTPSTGSFTDISTSGTATLATATISAGNIDNTIIGSSTPAAITATDLITTGSATLPTVTLGQGTGTVGTLNGVIVGGSNPLAVTGTIITANNGFTGDLTGDVTGNVTAASGTSTFTNLTVSGTLTGDITGDLTGNVTSAGTSTFNNVTISGTLNMDGATTATIQNLSAPVNPNDAARKTDVDTAIANLVDTAPSTLDTLNELAAALNDDPNFSTTITNSIATKLSTAGGTMSGDLDMGSNSITSVSDPVNTQDAATKNYVDTKNNLKLDLTGGTMSGTIAMGNNTISGVPNPSANDQVSNKAYVDSILGSATSAAASAAAASTSEGNALSSANDAAASATEAEDWATETATTVDGTEYSAKEYAIGTQTRGVTGSAKDWAVYTGGTVNGTEYSAKYWSSQAQTYATDAETSFNDFDTRYLGAKSTAPTTDNSGNTLATGSLYFNTSDGQLYLWTGSVWTQAAFTAQGFMTAANNLSDLTNITQARTNLNVDEAGTALALAIALG